MAWSDKIGCINELVAIDNQNKMKKKVPLQVHEFMEPYLDKKGEHFQSISKI